MVSSKKIIFTLLLIVGLVILIGLHYVLSINPLIISLILLLIVIAVFVIRFERRNVSGRELVLLAVLSAIAAVSRIPFATLPSVQPTTFIVIMTGSVFGAESGLVVGMMAALVSNLFLGQGPWTPWQMLGWGMIGLASGALRKTWLMKTLWGRCIFGVLAGFIFGWIMNVWALLGLSGQIDIQQILAYYGLSFYFDAAHAISNLFFMIVFSKAWMKILQRFKRKYGFLSLSE